MCIPLLPWVILGTLGTPTHRGTGQWFLRRESGAYSTEKLLRVLAHGGGDSRPLYAVQQSHSLSPPVAVVTQQLNTLQSDSLSSTSTFVTYYLVGTLGKLLICNKHDVLTSGLNEWVSERVQSSSQCGLLFPFPLNLPWTPTALTLCPSRALSGDGLPVPRFVCLVCP